MKLAEALMQRAQMQQRLENLQSRILANLKVQEGMEPHEDPQELIAQAFATNEEMGELIIRINARNTATVLPDGKRLSDVLTERDTLMRNRNLLAACTGKAMEPDYRLARAEVKMFVTVSVSDLQRRVDALSKELRELDVKIQEVNWTTEL